MQGKFLIREYIDMNRAYLQNAMIDRSESSSPYIFTYALIQISNCVLFYLEIWCCSRKVLPVVSETPLIDWKISLLSCVLHTHIHTNMLFWKCRCMSLSLLLQHKWRINERALMSTINQWDSLKQCMHAHNLLLFKMKTSTDIIYSQKGSSQGSQNVSPHNRK